MKTKYDIQLELLQEIDEICSKNNLRYILVGNNALNVYINHTIKDGPKMIGVAMTQGDIDRFCDIIEKQYSDKRFVEGMFNNPKFNPSFVNYGNKNTTYFNMVNLNNNLHHGIHVRIYPIRKSAKLDGNPIIAWTSRLKKEAKLRKLLNKKILNDKFWYLKWGLKILNAAYSLTGGSKRYYKEIKKNIFIDKWEDIQDYSLVRVINREISTAVLKELNKYEADSVMLSMPKDADAYFTEVYNENYKNRVIKNEKIRNDVIVDTGVGYEKIIESTKEIINETRNLHEEIVFERKKFKNEKKTVSNVWRLVKMTNKQIEFKQYYKENINDLLKMDLTDEEQFEFVYDELKRPINSLRRYAEYGMTFSIDPKTDALIEKVLLMKDNEVLVSKIKKLSEKEFFIE